MKRWLLLVVLANVTGCMPYVYPTLSHTPTVAVPNQDLSVHAFRVDIERTERHPGPASCEYTLSRIAVDERGMIPSQLELAHASGTYDPFSLMGRATHERTKYSMLIRLYRPGYRTMEVKEWEKSSNLNWVQAKDLTEQERAIDDLVSERVSRDESYLINAAPGLTQRDPSWWELKDQKSALGLRAGLHAPASHRQTLFFAASEYERLAMSPAAAQPNAQAIRDRLRAKGAWLRAYADAAPAAHQPSANVNRNPTPPPPLPNGTPNGTPNVTPVPSSSGVPATPTSGVPSPPVWQPR